MDSYAELEIFCQRDIDLFNRAVELVALVPGSKVDGEDIRCHELTRAVGSILKLPHVDGKYNSVEHSWLLCVDNVLEMGGLRALLDVYAVGALPQVQLIDLRSWGPLRRAPYKEGPVRDDIRHHALEELLHYMRGG